MVIRHVAAFSLDRPEDVFVLRQHGRIAAASVGCDEAAQVRFATALSELGREAVAHGAHARAFFSLDHENALVVDIEDFPRAVHGTSSVGIDAARRLIDGITVSAGSGPTATVQLRRLAGRTDLQINAGALRAALARTAPPQPLDELRLENRDLIATLGRLNAQQEQLSHLNGELEETNRGVMAMYAQLSDELEETNRGVVALYAELDDKSQRLNEASDAKSRFLASISHELRSPLNSVLGLAQLMLDPEADPLSESQRTQIHLMVRSSKELLGLVNDLLDLAKAESGRLEPHVEPVDLAELFSELRGSLRPLARAGVDLQVEVPDSLTIESDRTLLTQVLRNLLTNALKFTQQGSVTLRACLVAAHQVEVTVADTGIGIDAADQARIFEEFFQVRGPLQGDQKGTGLGLPYARRVTQTLGGQMRLRSALGRGSVFTLQFSVHWQSLLNAGRSPARQSQDAVNVGTVLIVDDDVSFRTALRGMLQGVATQVHEAAGGISGLELMRRIRPDLAFIDLKMPDLDGPAVLAQMSTEPALRAIPVVIVTSADLNDGTRRTLGDVCALLAKSNINRETVCRAVSEALA